MYRMTWTDGRMDDFAAHTDRRFDGVDRRLDSLERRMEVGFERIDQRFEQIDHRFERIDQRFERVEDRFNGLHQMVHRTMLQVGAGLIVTVAIGFAGIVATQL